VYSIGEFSRITGLTVKTLRFYHEKGVLAPAAVDGQTGYRSYGERHVEKARIIAQLRSLDFSLEEIGGMLASADDEGDLLDHLERHKAVIEEKVRRYGSIGTALDRIIRREREARMVRQSATFDVEEKTLDTLLMAGVRMKGRYGECGRGFARIGKALGRYVSGKCFLLHYDPEYKEEGADFEACMPLRKAKAVDGISVPELPEGGCVSLVHRGPYEDLGRSYAKLLAYLKEKGYEVVLPTREVYLKGPGMVFRGNPKNYLTEIQMLVKEGRRS
jgi:DNA-binding transcriptional MerR regulator